MGDVPGANAEDPVHGAGPNRPPLEVRQSEPEAGPAIRSGSAISGFPVPPDVPCAGALLGGGIERRGSAGADLRFEVFDGADRHWRRRNRSAAAARPSLHERRSPASTMTQMSEHRSAEDLKQRYIETMREELGEFFHHLW